MNRRILHRRRRSLYRGWRCLDQRGIDDWRGWSLDNWRRRVNWRSLHGRRNLDRRVDWRRFHGRRNLDGWRRCIDRRCIDRWRCFHNWRNSNSHVCSRYFHCRGSSSCCGICLEPRHCCGEYSS
jgi:hypothetical protein